MIQIEKWNFRFSSFSTLSQEEMTLSDKLLESTLIILYLQIKVFTPNIKHGSKTNDLFFWKFHIYIILLNILDHKCNDYLGFCLIPVIPIKKKKET